MSHWIYENEPTAPGSVIMVTVITTYLNPSPVSVFRINITVIKRETYKVTEITMGRSYSPKGQFYNAEKSTG